LLPASPPREAPRPVREKTSGFASSHGELPVSRPPSATHPKAPDHRGSPQGDGDLTIRRTKVTLTAVPARRFAPDDDIRVYLAPAVDGLRTFDLGSVPASVTPPKTWKKAAWFAALSSGGVVVALLFAGSVLVGPTSTDQASRGWPGYRGGHPLLNGEEETGSNSAENRGIAGKPRSNGLPTRQPSDASRSPDDATSGSTDTNAGSSLTAPGSTGEFTVTEPPPTSTTVPPKPRDTPPLRETTFAPWYSFPPSAKAMGDNTEKFFNTVADDPKAAATVTTGKLRDEGPQALARHYADVAYFEVKDICIDQNRGITVNTVEVTHDDGTKTIERRTLTFGDDAKIASDGR
jgi:hypothetical protein